MANVWKQFADKIERYIQVFVVKLYPHPFCTKKINVRHPKNYLENAYQVALLFFAPSIQLSPLEVLIK